MGRNLVSSLAKAKIIHIAFFKFTHSYKTTLHKTLSPKLMGMMFEIGDVLFSSHYDLQVLHLKKKRNLPSLNSHWAVTGSHRPSNEGGHFKDGIMCFCNRHHFRLLIQMQFHPQSEHISALKGLRGRSILWHCQRHLAVFVSSSEVFWCCVCSSLVRSWRRRG